MTLRSMRRWVAAAWLGFFQIALLLGLVGCAPRAASPPEALELQRRQSAERQATLNQVENGFPCFFENPLPSNYDYRGKEPFTAEELDVFRAVYAKLVMTYLIWSVTPIDGPLPSVFAVEICVPFEKEFAAPSADFLDAIATPTTKAIAWQENLNYWIPRCTLEFRSWLSPDSAYVFADVGLSGHMGRGALAVRDGSDWKVCPTEWIVQ